MDSTADYLEQAARKAVELAERAQSHGGRLLVEMAQHLTYLAGLIRGGAVDDVPQTIRFASGMPFDEQVVGPDGETRAEARALTLKGLEEFRDEVIEAQRNGRIDQMAAFRMRLQIHREKCALVGLGIATYPQAF